MKIVLIAVAVLCVFDAVAWKSTYRIAMMHKAENAANYVTRQNWSWMS